MKKIAHMCVMKITGIHGLYAAMKKDTLEAVYFDEDNWRSLANHIRMLFPDSSGDLVDGAKEFASTAGSAWDQLGEKDRIAVMCAYALTLDSPGLPAVAVRIWINDERKWLLFAQSVIGAITP